MNILMIVSNSFTHDPRVYNEAVSLTKHGHTVTVLCWDREKKHIINEIKDGIRIVRFRNTGYMDFLPYDFLRLRPWWRGAYKTAIALHDEQNFDAVHCHDLDTLPIGAKMKKRKGLKLVYDAHEIWGYMIARDLPKVWVNHFLKKEKKLLKNVDRLITVNEPLKNYFKKIGKATITIIMNCKPLQEKVYHAPDNKSFTLLYLGSLTKSRFLSELLEVMGELPDVRCIIGGKGKTEYENALKEKCLKMENAEFVGFIPMDEVIPLTMKSDTVVCMTDPNDANNSRATANKQFEAMVCGRPIICTKGTYPGTFTEKLQCGLVADYTRNDLKAKITELKQNPKLCEKLGKNALNAAIEKYCWEKQEEKLVEIYETF